MGYHEFLCVMEKNLNRKLEGGVTASVHVTVKNNGKIKRGILVEDPQVNISPTIYLEEFYEQFQNGESMESISEAVLKFYESVRCSHSWDTKEVEEFEEAKKKIVFKVINRKRNAKLLEEVPHMDWMDLSIVFYVLLDIKKDGTATMLVRNEHLKMWNITEQELFPIACGNTVQLLPARIFTMKEILEGLMSSEGMTSRDVFDETAELPMDVMYVLTNTNRTNGSGCLFLPGVLDQLGKIFQGDYYILPSSVHEVIIVPQNKGFEAEELNEMVKEVNATQVEEEEQLSDHAYYYDWKKKQLEMR